MSGKTSDQDFFRVNIKGSRLPWWETLPVEQRVQLLKRVALMLSSVSDLQQFLHQQMTSSPEYARSKHYSFANKMAELLSLSVAKAVRRYAVPLVEATAGSATKMASSKSAPRTRTTRKATRT